MKIISSDIKDVKRGKDITIITPVNLYDCEIGDNCFVGPFTEIQKGVKIGTSTKIQSHSFLCELLTIGNNCVIGHGVVFINDKFSSCHPANGDKKLWLETKIGNNVYIGSNSTILPVTICNNVVIGAGSVVTKNIYQEGIYAGNPAKKIK